MTMSMEGTLWKWTNYFSGWQSRWFILDNGILSYYKSADDVNNGCKGSIKMAVCDVIVHSADNTRLDLIIPGEAHFYVKAATPHERQQWLVALGSCKACLSEGSTAGRLSSQDEIPVDELKSKKSELRLYCDLLMQQVYSVKSAVQETPVPNIEKLDEATLLLSATCDTFINALEDCVKLANASVSLEGAASTHSSNNNDSVVPPSPNRRSAGTRSQPFSWSSGAPSIQRSMSVDRVQPVVRPQRRRSSSQSTSEQTNGSRQTRQSSLSQVDSGVVNEDTRDVPLPSFLQSMTVSFTDIQLRPEGGVPTEAFLDACGAILPVFDRLNATAFAPVKLDMAANINKIHQKFSMNPVQFDTLQQIVEFEIKARQCRDSRSATVALLWLKRYFAFFPNISTDVSPPTKTKAIEFCHEFLVQFASTSDHLSVIANNVYTKTLKDFHSYVVRGAFMLVLKSMPTREEFLQLVRVSSEHINDPTLGAASLKEIELYTAAQKDIIIILNAFYTSCGLEFTDKV